jgi:thiosulfate/3-mercaptopyruvate sulfurtransferase
MLNFESRTPIMLSLLALFLLVGSSGCGESVEGPDTSVYEERTPQPLNEQVFIGVDDFEQFRAEGAAVLDARSDVADYESGHVPGAVHAPWSVLKDADSNGAFVEDDPFLAEEAIRGLGINHGQKVLVYSDAVSTTAARQAWALEYFGHGDVYILNGGVDAWSAESGEALSTEAADIEAGDYEVALRKSVLATSDDLRRVVDGETEAILFDARSFPEYEGTDDRDNPRHGHVPNAIHYEWTNAFTEHGKLRGKEELRAELEEAGLLVEDAVIIPYCQGGFRSAIIYSVLRWLGEGEVKNYDGSWYEWSRTEGAPVETE